MWTKRDLTLLRTDIERHIRRRQRIREFRRLGWKQILAAHREERQGIILVYHRVNGIPSRDFRPTRDLSVSPEDFEKHLQFLGEHFTVVPLKLVVERLRSGAELPVNFAVITFDDGYEDNFTDAYPLLLRYGLPATIFVTAGLMETDELLWNDRLEHLIRETNRRRIVLEASGGKRDLDLRTKGEKWYAYELLTELILGSPSSRRDTFLDELARALGSTADGAIAGCHRLLNWDQARKMCANGLVDICSHTMTHQLVTRMDEKTREHELGHPRKLIQKETGIDIPVFAFPHGALDARSIDYLESAGYWGACTTKAGLVSHRCAPFKIPRVGVGGMELEGLVVKIASLMDRNGGRQREGSA